MTGHEMKEVLKSMEILVDTREQETEKFFYRVKDFGVPYKRATLDYGDYSYNVTLPNGKQLYDISERVCPKVAIERKYDLNELASCLTHTRKRFIKEFERAQENNSHIYLLVENAGFDEIIIDQYNSWITPQAYMGSVMSLMVRYGVQIVFCKDFNSGIMIKNILYHDLKDRLRKGEFDEEIRGCVGGNGGEQVLASREIFETASMAGSCDDGKLEGVS